MVIRERLDRIQSRIERACDRAGRNPEYVKLIAVSKTVSVDRIKEAAECGIRCFGENYVQEALPKIQSLGSGLEWHFIGHLQRNKAKFVLGHFHLIHTVDRLPLAKELNKRASGKERVPILIQVNISGEETKFGIPPEGLRDLIKGIVEYPNLQIRGLMTMPPFFDEPEKARPYFQALRHWREDLQSELPPPHTLEELSMGMTGDFEAAVEEGATLVRIGTAIFGPRTKKE